MSAITYLKPRIKSFIEYCWNDGLISFFRIPGIAIELTDKSRFIFTTCKLMDGLSSLATIKQQLFLSHPNEVSYLDKLLSVLDREYLLEDVSKSIPSNLSEYEVTRWSRNIEFFGAYCKALENKYTYQEKLKSINVAILGLGGVGSNVLANLMAIGVQNVRAVDFDRVELSNLNRQLLYNESDVGEFKSEAAKARILEFLPQAKIEVLNKKISSLEELDQITTGQDIVISAVDYPREKILDWVNAACVKKKIPYICGGLDSKWATYYSIVPGKTGCMQCWKLKVEKSKMTFQDFLRHDQFKFSESPNVAIMPLISIVAGLVTNEFLKLCTGISEPQAAGRLCVFDFLSSRITVEETWERDPRCGICKD